MRVYNFFEILKEYDFPFHIEFSMLSEDFQKHGHEFSELIIVLGGEGVHVVDNQRFSLKAGDIYVLNGDMSHSFEQVQNLKLCNIMFDLHRFMIQYDEFRKLSGFQYLFILEPFYRSENQFESKLFLTPADLKYIETMLSLLHREYSERKDGFHAVINSYFLALVAYLSRQYDATKDIASKGLHYIVAAITFLENNYTDKLTIEELANIAHLSKRHFIRIFKQNYSVTPMEYIIQLRLQHASKLLVKSTINISEIAMESGFSDIGFFSRQFKNKLGVTPSEFRRNYSPYNSKPR